MLTQNPGSRMSSVFTNNLGDNFALVILTVPGINGIIGTEPHVYIDTDGRMVAFFLNTQNAAALMQWNSLVHIQSGAFSSAGITTTVLEDAIQRTLIAAGITVHG